MHSVDSLVKLVCDPYDYKESCKKLEFQPDSYFVWNHYLIHSPTFSEAVEERDCRQQLLMQSKGQTQWLKWLGHKLVLESLKDPVAVSTPGQECHHLHYPVCDDEREK